MIIKTLLCNRDVDDSTRRTIVTAVPPSQIYIFNVNNTRLIFNIFLRIRLLAPL